MSAGSIFRGSKANKRGLSLALDATLKSSHDMKVFGLGAIAEFTLEKYRHFALQRLYFYNAMETRFDNATTGGISKVWPKYEAELRQYPCLIEDLKQISVDDPFSIRPSPSTQAYCEAIERSSNDALVGHFYTRYFADLFGGSMLGYPTHLALGIPTPSFYSFPSTVTGHRAAYIESIYEAINEAGDEMEEIGRANVVEETKEAFRYNAEIIKEQGVELVPYIAKGVFNVSNGYVRKVLLRG